MDTFKRERKVNTNKVLLLFRVRGLLSLLVLLFHFAALFHAGDVIEEQAHVWTC